MTFIALSTKLLRRPGGVTGVSFAATHTHRHGWMPLGEIWGSGRLWHEERGWSDKTNPLLLCQKQEEKIQKQNLVTEPVVNHLDRHLARGTGRWEESQEIVLWVRGAWIIHGWIPFIHILMFIHLRFERFSWIIKKKHTEWISSGAFLCVFQRNNQPAPTLAERVGGKWHRSLFSVGGSQSAWVSEKLSFGNSLKNILWESTKQQQEAETPSSDEGQWWRCSWGEHGVVQK